MKSTIRFAVFLALATASCSAPKQATVNTPVQPASPVLLEVGDLKVTTDEFKYLYEKNYGKTDTSYTEANVKEYIALFTNFKLKIKDAMAKGLDQSEEYKAELESYRKQLARPYLTDNKVSEDLIKETYNNMTQEVKASHILVRLNENALPADTLKAYQKTLALRDSVTKKKMSFDDVAFRYSEDPSAKQNKGSLGYFTAMQMVYEFEKAAYATPIGTVAGPFRTRFGYHLLQVQDKRPSRGSVKTAHIMVRATSGISAEDSLAAYRKASEIFTKAKNGEDWATLCRQFSDDVNTRENGGELQPFSVGSMIESFAEAAFALKNNGDITGPIQTPYGWHIIKLLDRRQIGSFEEVAPQLRQKITRDSRSEVSKKMFIEKLKKENNLVENAAVKEAVLASFDTTLLAAQWKMDTTSALASKTLFSIGASNYTVKSFYEHVGNVQRPQKGITPAQYANSLYGPYVDQTVMAYEEDHLESKYPEYRFLLQEYREGIMLFKIMEENIWTPAVQDTVGLAAYFAENQANYQWTERANATMFSCADQATYEKVKAAMQTPLFEMENLQQTYSFAYNAGGFSDVMIQEVNELISQMQAHPEYQVVAEGWAGNGETKSILEMRFANLKKLLENEGLKTEKLTFTPLATPKGQKAKTGGQIMVKVFTSSATVLETKLNQTDALAVKLTEGWFEKKDNATLAKLEWKQGDFRVEADNRIFFVRIHEVAAPRNKKMDEIKGQLISDYQASLEKKWLEQLRAKYPVKTNDAEIEKLYKK